MLCSVPPHASSFHTHRTLGHKTVSHARPRWLAGPVHSRLSLAAPVAALPLAAHVKVGFKTTYPAAQPRSQVVVPVSAFNVLVQPLATALGS